MMQLEDFHWYTPSLRMCEEDKAILAANGWLPDEVAPAPAEACTELGADDPRYKRRWGLWDWLCVGVLLFHVAVVVVGVIRVYA